MASYGVFVTKDCLDPMFSSLSEDECIKEAKAYIQRAGIDEIPELFIGKIEPVKIIRGVSSSVTFNTIELDN